ncbi:hypothetical protein J2W22_002409 [Sphingomonas kyeonggiensis]|nr:hypothetical protein [Sphingomonas kyeonggiensis]
MLVFTDYRRRLMSYRIPLGMLFGAVFLSPGSALAQEKPPTADSAQIVVQGNKNLKRDIAKFVGALAEDPATSQLSRFEDAVCPKAVGLPPVQAEAVANRMRQVAEAAGIRVGKPGCRVNVVAIVTPDKHGFLKLLSDRKPDYFGDLEPIQIRRLVAEKGPATAWQLQGPAISARGTVIMDGVGGPPMNTTAEPATRLRATARPQFAAAVVVIDAAAVDGLTARQLADYAAMRTYAGTKPSRLEVSTATTILKVLEAPMGSETPSSLTNWDLGFLRGLYASPPNAYAGVQRGAIRAGVNKQVQEGETEKN